MSDDDNDDRDAGVDTGVATKTKPKTKKPPMYKVMLLNDDYTPMEFVVLVLEKFFGINHAQSVEIMLTVRFCPPQPAPAAMHHGKGIGVHACPP